MRVKVKICGIVNVADAQHAAAVGADAIGFLVGPNHMSEDHVSDLDAQKMIASLPPFVASTLIFHTGNIEDIVKTTQTTGASSITLHEGVNPPDIAHIKGRLPHIAIFKSIYVMDEQALQEAKEWEQTPITAIHLDTADMSIGKRGGTGKVHDWNVSARIARECAKPVMIAGGLNPDNVAAAVRTIAPYAVDVNTGTRASNGLRDREKVNLFVKHAKTA